jgi:two-component system cell cycle response regulator
MGASRTAPRHDVVVASGGLNPRRPWTSRHLPVTKCQPAATNFFIYTVSGGLGRALDGSGQMTHSTKVLIADANPVSRTALHSMISGWGYQVTVAADGEQAWNLLKAEDGPRMAILDTRIGGIDAVELCRRVRAANRLNYAYLLLLTESGPIEELVAGLDGGADDYVTRPFHSQEFRARLQAGCRIIKLQERLIEAHEQLYEQATRDSLTGLWNRIAAVQILDREIARAARNHSAMAVIMADLDRFKSVNDTHGHLAGDAVLREAARRMSSVLRKYDSIGRYGGEEFLIVVPECHFADSLAVAERVREAVSGQPFPVGDEEYPVSCSFGLAWSDGLDDTDANWLLRQADTALYAAKRKGRNCVEAFEEAEAGSMALAGGSVE